MNDENPAVTIAQPYLCSSSSWSFGIFTTLRYTYAFYGFPFPNAVCTSKNETGAKPDFKHTITLSDFGILDMWILNYVRVHFRHEYE